MLLSRSVLDKGSINITSLEYIHAKYYITLTMQKLGKVGNLGPVQTSNFICAESDANEQNLLFSLISIRFGTFEVRRLNRA